MPIKDCTVDGKSGRKYGDSGKCYTGRDANKKAIKQAVAIKIAKGEIKPKNKFQEFKDKVLDLQQILNKINAEE